jgi:two-component system, LytTR family, sensor kinase
VNRLKDVRYTRWLALVVVWAALGLILSIEVYFSLRVSMPEVEFGDVLGPQYMRVSLWAILTPLVLWLRTAIPLRAGYWVGGLTFHFGVSSAIMGVYYLGRVWLIFWREGAIFADFWMVAQQSFFGSNMIDVIIYWAVLGTGYTFEIYRKYKNEQIRGAQLESRLVQSELSALKQQLHPHFLFNTMNTISVLVREGRNNQAVQLLARLSGLLRTTLDSAGIEEVTVRQEMDFIERYVEIQKMRFADRLTVVTDVSAEALESRVPNLLLQPLVENAIQHGVSPKRGPGRVTVSGRVVDHQLQLEVSDDGVGIEDGQIKRAREGIGLSNTRERLSRLYGASSQLVMKSEPGRGTLVSIVLPCRV